MTQLAGSGRMFARDCSGLPAMQQDADLLASGANHRPESNRATGSSTGKSLQLIFACRRMREPGPVDDEEADRGCGRDRGLFLDPALSSSSAARRISRLGFGPTATARLRCIRSHLITQY
ncbi:uncharacterized protein LOC112459907 [Temnothorax curvispinosus]|uniref:Uncharacterized protein LOC112459907 n=1 Tax=Temnothorax curvispinosus TaxID=300111 RepID=A0A6J1QHC7_9HYME|nr:uncharacterized protein LOC112459907 [Temnothorax curvispinosus]